jgi:hypothetical protein
MSTISATATRTGTASTTRVPLLKAGAVVAAVAAVATTTVAVVAHAAGVSFADSTGESIPWFAFAQLTFVCAMLGVGLAAGVRRRAAHPQRTFTRVAWTLAAVSCVAPTLIGLSVAATATLVVDHLVAAAIVVPALASRLRR